MLLKKKKSQLTSVGFGFLLSLLRYFFLFGFSGCLQLLALWSFLPQFSQHTSYPFRVTRVLSSGTVSSSPLLLSFFGLLRCVFGIGGYIGSTSRSMGQSLGLGIGLILGAYDSLYVSIKYHLLMSSSGRRLFLYIAQIA
jgi:hypothetical protein